MGLFSRDKESTEIGGAGIGLPGLETQRSVGTLEREETQVLEPGDHERFSHYVKKEKIVESAVTGIAVTALCGKKWIPTRDPEKFPVCPTCKELYSQMQPPKEDQ